MPSEHMIICDGLSKCYHIYDQPHHRLLQMIYRGTRQFYREFWALQSVSFALRKGESIGIVGRNGSGKSTLLQLISGTLNPTAGKIFTQGRIAALLELGAGFNHEFTGRENISLNARLLGLSQTELENRIDDILAFADIGEFIDQPIKTYSSGMMVRLAFAVIAHVGADLLIIDEALAVGDAAFTRRCMRFIRQFKQDNSMLFVSHDLSSVLSLCDQTMWLDKGRVRDAGKTKQVCDNYLNTILFNESNLEQPKTNKLEALLRNRVTKDNLELRDQRQDLINHSNLRNDLEVFHSLTTEPRDFGGQLARVVDVSILDWQGYPLAWIVGGERVTIAIEVEAFRDLEHIVIGFYVRDKLGQNIFGDNTYLSFMDAPKSLASGQRLTAEFEFIMPWLMRGHYSVVAAIATREGESDHILHWNHDALAFQSHVAPLPTGMVGIPMLDIRFREK